MEFKQEAVSPVEGGLPIDQGTSIRDLALGYGFQDKVTGGSRGIHPVPPQLCIVRRLLAIDIRMPSPRPSVTMAVPP